MLKQYIMEDKKILLGVGITGEYDPKLEEAYKKFKVLNMDDAGMEIDIVKNKDYVRIFRTRRNADNYYSTSVGCRKNSAMTKDLIKQEVMYRVYSFRPNPLSIILAKGLKVGNKPLVLDSVYKNVVSGFIEGYCKGVNWDSSAEKN